MITDFVKYTKTFIVCQREGPFLPHRQKGRQPVFTLLFYPALCPAASPSASQVPNPEEAVPFAKSQRRAPAVTLVTFMAFWTGIVDK